MTRFGLGSHSFSRFFALGNLGARAPSSKHSGSQHPPAVLDLSEMRSGWCCCQEVCESRDFISVLASSGSVSVCLPLLAFSLDVELSLSNWN